METTAQLNNLRITPRKVRLVSGTLRGMDVVRAKHQLDYLAKRSARPLAKLLDSAIANAQTNFGQVKENLYIKQIIVNEGVKLKRFRPKGFGMTSPLEKKTSHIRLVLDERVPGKKRAASAESVPTKPAVEAKAEATPRPKEKPRPSLQPEKEIKKPGMLGGLKRRFFRRKTI